MDAKKWIEDVLGQKVAWGSDEDGPGSGFADGLKSGDVLCKYVLRGRRYVSKSLFFLQAFRVEVIFHNYL